MNDPSFYQSRIIKSFRICNRSPRTLDNHISIICIIIRNTPLSSTLLPLRRAIYPAATTKYTFHKYYVYKSDLADSSNNKKEEGEDNASQPKKAIWSRTKPDFESDPADENDDAGEDKDRGPPSSWRLLDASIVRRLLVSIWGTKPPYKENTPLG